MGNLACSVLWLPSSTFRLSFHNWSSHMSSWEYGALFMCPSHPTSLYSLLISSTSLCCTLHCLNFIKCYCVWSCFVFRIFVLLLKHKHFCPYLLLINRFPIVIKILIIATFSILINYSFLLPLPSVPAKPRFPYWCFASKWSSGIDSVSKESSSIHMVLFDSGLLPCWSIKSCFIIS